MSTMPPADLEGLSREFSRRYGAGVEEKNTRRAWTQVAPEKLYDALSFLKEAGYGHLSTITAVDAGTDFEVIYHFFGQGRVLSVRTLLGKEEAKIPSVTGIFPGASLYERELHDLFGIYVTGHPDLKPLILPEGWPEGEHPLRKDWAPADGGGAGV